MTAHLVTEVERLRHRAITDERMRWVIALIEAQRADEGPVGVVARALRIDRAKATALLEVAAADMATRPADKEVDRAGS